MANHFKIIRVTCPPLYYYDESAHKTRRVSRAYRVVNADGLPITDSSSPNGQHERDGFFVRKGAAESFALRLNKREGI